ncbi:MAG: hypothetical protein ACD_72C00096G0004 [uncultured bacterium]|nr:MAG: hypothetical protein ACD_72C00096G0004 [uncultured bacterium]
MPKKNSGFTLIELLLYITLAAIILLAVNLFIASILQSRIKNETIINIENQGQSIIQLITQNIHNTKQVNLPNQTTLQITDANNQPIVFSLADGVINLIQNNIVYPLISSRTMVTNLKFTNLSTNPSTPSIKIEFTLQSINPNERNENEYIQNFYATATTRP